MEKIKKKVGIITMHKVVNYGSALQAYALQRKIDDLGFESFLIDYTYPNEYLLSERTIKLSIRKIIKVICVRLFFFLFYKKKKQLQLFNQFWKNNFQLTEIYRNKKEIFDNPPDFDVYVTGSDQVWNPVHMKGDPTFFCDFVKNGNKRISYAASFSSGDIDINYKLAYREYLNKYAFISVRENKGVDVVNNLIRKDAICVCDPTLLLTKDEYSHLSNQSTLNIDKPYILAYILNYNFNPYPTIQEVIDKIKRKTKLPVVYLLCNTLNATFKPNSKIISAAGPNEFLWLFQHASYIVTSSFHGVAFSLIFEKQFYAVTENTSKDGRIRSLLEETGTGTRMILTGDDVDSLSVDELDYSLVRDKLENYRNKSIEFLQKSLF